MTARTFSCQAPWDGYLILLPKVSPCFLEIRGIWELTPVIFITATAATINWSRFKPRRVFARYRHRTACTIPREIREPHGGRRFPAPLRCIRRARQAGEVYATENKFSARDLSSVDNQ